MLIVNKVLTYSECQSANKVTGRILQTCEEVSLPYWLISCRASTLSSMASAEYAPTVSLSWNEKDDIALHFDTGTAL